MDKLKKLYRQKMFLETEDVKEWMGREERESRYLQVLFNIEEEEKRRCPSSSSSSVEENLEIEEVEPIR